MDFLSLEASGWTALEAVGFTGLAGPYWTQGSGAERIVGFLAETRHGNGREDTVHGGSLMTFADIALGCAAADVLGHGLCATVQLQIQFVAAGQTGDFITCRPEVVRRSSQLVFVRGLVIANDRTLASVDGIWKELKQR